MVLPWTTNGFALILGLACLTLGIGCRSSSPTDWVGERMAMTQAWQGQSSQVRSEDASFQEGWRNGFQEGRSHGAISPPDREPAKVEAFMNSKRNEAMADWRRGYDSGFTAALGSDDRHQAHSKLFPDAGNAAVETVQMDTTTIRDQPTNSLFEIPRNRSLEQEPISSTELVKSSSSIATETISQPPVGFDNAAVVLDSVIKKNGEFATLSHDSKPTVSSQPGATQPAKPESSGPGPEPGLQPESNRSVIELPIHDDDVANTSHPSHSQLGLVPQAYQGRIQTGHIIPNPYVTSNRATSPETPSAEQASTVAPNQAPPLLTTNANEFRAAAPIPTNAPDSPFAQVRHEVQPSSPASSTTIDHLPKGLPLRKQK